MPSLTTADDFKPEPAPESPKSDSLFAPLTAKQSEQRFRRAPAIHRKLSNIDPENDIRVRIIGTVVSADSGAFIIDDGTTSKEILSDMPVHEGAFIRIFARVMPLETGCELRAELIQDMAELDKEKYEQVFFP
jgi:hypothetical protein